jgi:hypothetical protein
MRRPLSPSRSRQCKGVVRGLVLAVLVALGIAAVMAIKMVRSGASDVGYIVAMSLAVVVGLALVAPDRFTSGSSGSEWGDDVHFGADRSCDAIEQEDREIQSKQGEGKSGS